MDLNIFKDIWQGLLETLGYLSAFLSRENLQEIIRTQLEFKVLMRSIWLPMLAVLISLMFFYKQKVGIAVAILVGMVALYVSYYLLPLVKTGLTGIALFSGVTMVAALVFIYLTLIRPE